MQTPQSLWIVAEQRLFDARKLLRGGRREVAAAYLAGFSVEMVLKGGYFRISTPTSRFPVTSLVESNCRYPDGRGASVPALPECGVVGTSFGPGAKGHNLRGWRALIVERRLSTAPALGALDAVMVGHVDTVAGLWSVDMRYGSTITRPDVYTVLQSANFIYNNRHLLHQ